MASPRTYITTKNTPSPKDKVQCDLGLKCNQYHTYVFHSNPRVNSKTGETILCNFRTDCNKVLPKERWEAAKTHCRAFSHVSAVPSPSDKTFPTPYKGALSPSAKPFVPPPAKPKTAKSPVVESWKAEVKSTEPVIPGVINTEPRKCMYVSTHKVYDCGRLMLVTCPNIIVPCPKKTTGDYKICKECFNSDNGKEWLKINDPSAYETYEKKLNKKNNKLKKATPVATPEPAKTEEHVEPCN
jgi:hypothetical protein